MVLILGRVPQIYLEKCSLIFKNNFTSKVWGLDGVLWFLMMQWSLNSSDRHREGLIIIGVIGLVAVPMLHQDKFLISIPTLMEIQVNNYII